MASSVLIVAFIFSCLSVIIMRESGLQNYRPKFTTPLYPWLQIAGIVFYSLLIIEMGREAVIAGLTLVITALFVYWFYGRIRTNREFALLHLITRITAKEFGSRDLESELKEIIRERDDIVKDRFDTIIENCIVMDIDQKLPVDDFFRLASEKAGAGPQNRPRYDPQPPAGTREGKQHDHCAGSGNSAYHCGW